MDVGGQRRAPAPPRKRSGSYFSGGWVGLRASMDGCGKISSLTGIRSPDRTVQLVASRYTDAHGFP